MPETHATRISDIVEFFQKLVQMAKTSSEDKLTVVLEALKEVLKHPHPKNVILKQSNSNK